MVNNKLKVVLTISEDDDQLAIEQLAFANNKIKSSLVGHKIVKKIYVHKKIFNLITKKG